MSADADTVKKAERLLYVSCELQPGCTGQQSGRDVSVVDFNS